MPAQTLLAGQEAASFAFGDSGATVANAGPSTVYYNDQPGVSASFSDGSIAAGATVTLYGQQWLYVDRAGNGGLRADLEITPLALVASSGGTAANPASAPYYAVADGTSATPTDNAAAFQAAFDANPHVHLSGGGTYHINSPVFLDATALGRRYRLTSDGNTHLSIGTAGATASGMVLDTGTKWIFFINTNRAALSAGAVTTSAGNRSTGGGFPPQPRLIVENLTIFGPGAAAGSPTNGTVGAFYGNTCATKFVNCNMRSLKYLSSWAQYSDGPTVDNLEISAPVTGGAAILATSPGDGMVIQGAKASAATVLRAYSNAGATILGAVGGIYELHACRGVKFVGGHQEVDTNNLPYAALIDNSQVTIDDEVFFLGSSQGPAISINDGASDASLRSDVLLNHCQFMRYFAAGAMDTLRDPAVTITAANDGTRLRAVGCAQTVYPQSSARPYPEGLQLSAVDSGITAALTAGADQIATGDFDLRKGAGAVWQVRPIYNGRRITRHLVAPTLAVAADTTTITGTLTNAQSYEYVVAAKSASGRYSPLSSAVAASADSHGVMRLTITNPSTPCVIAVWRKTGAGVTSTPDKYAEIPLDGYSTGWIDTGTYINGRLWTTASIPVPTTVAAPGSVATLATAPAGAIFETFKREGLFNTSVTLVDGIAHMTLFETDGGYLSNLCFRGGGVAGVGVANFWIAVTDLLGKVIAVTANQTALAASTNVSLAVTTPVLLPPGVYYQAVMVHATTTMPTFIGSSGAGSSLANVVPFLTGNCPTTSQTTPPAVGATLPIPTAGTGVAPYVYGT